MIGKFFYLIGKKILFGSKKNSKINITVFIVAFQYDSITLTIFAYKTLMIYNK